MNTPIIINLSLISLFIFSNCQNFSSVISVQDTEFTEYDDGTDDLVNETLNNNSSLLKISKLMYDKLRIDDILNKQYVVGSSDLLRLRKSLLYFYDKKTRPLLNSKQPIHIYIGVSVSQINKLDEVYQVSLIKFCVFENESAEK